MLMIGCTNQNSGDLEKRMTALEKSSAEKDKQIEGLTIIAYSDLMLASDLDSTRNFSLPKSFAKYNLISKAQCKAECWRRYRAAEYICYKKYGRNSDKYIQCGVAAYDKFEGCEEICQHLSN